MGLIAHATRFHLWAFACALVFVAAFRVVLADPRDAVLIEYQPPTNAQHSTATTLHFQSGEH